MVLRRAVAVNGLTGFCVTKLDVLDGMDEVKVAIRYRLGDRQLDAPPTEPALWPDLEPIYKTFPGWQESTRGITRMNRPSG